MWESLQLSQFITNHEEHTLERKPYGQRIVKPSVAFILTKTKKELILESNPNVRKWESLSSITKFSRRGEAHWIM